MFNNLFFYITINDRGHHTTAFWFEPEEIKELLLYYNSFMQSSKRVNVLINKIKEQSDLEYPSEDLGENETSLMIKGGMAVLNAEYISGIPETKIDIIYLVDFLNLYHEWLLKYESCQIPGIIPKSKLATWSCVPNEYVKPEYWELLKKQQEAKE